ncbi:MAG TPA: serine/threonine-protein kinase, partial [Candidatus Nanopelagicales bacterium]|nr:serine/threonine-protein kinase [Candidatus Nanopelagicales bacterium]
MRHSDPKIAPTLASAAEAVEPSHEPTDHVPGEHIAGKYRLTRVLGVGGMGAVWQARNEALEVDVAVKLIRRDTATEVSPERLLREARAAARVDHPSVVRIFDFGETELGEPFIVMELLGGEPLRHLLLRKERLPALGAVQTLLPVASALGAAHAKGVIHRDLKPENVLLTRDERGAVIPKVVDFGIAKLRHGGEPQVTQEGAALGSPAYMSPEQARGQDDIDGRADVWSLSVVLYEAITGQLPFDGRSYNALLAAILEDPPRPASDLIEIDDTLWRIIERGLCKDRLRRWQSMQELGEALATWAVGRGADADVTGRSIALAWLDRIARRPYTDPP